MASGRSCVPSVSAGMTGCPCVWSLKEEEIKEKDGESQRGKRSAETSRQTHPSNRHSKEWSVLKLREAHKQLHNWEWWTCSISFMAVQLPSRQREKKMSTQFSATMETAGCRHLYIAIDVTQHLTEPVTLHPSSLLHCSQWWLHIFFSVYGNICVISE